MSNLKSRMPRPLLRWIRRLRGIPARLREWPQQRRMLGRSAALALGWSALRYPIGDPADPAGPLSRVRIEGLPHPFWFRHGTSDVEAIRQIFVRREYQLLDRLTDVKTILDIGANIGAASVFLLNLFPQARVIALEPAPGNFDVLEPNLAPYGRRATAVRAAIWPSPAKLRIERGRFRDGLDWSIQVRPDESGGDVAGMTMARLLAENGIEQVDLLKIDIERAERELFAGETAWLRKVRNLCVELHDEECRRAFASALQGYQYDLETREETTLVTGIVAR